MHIACFAVTQNEDLIGVDKTCFTTYRPIYLN